MSYISALKIVNLELIMQIFTKVILLPIIMICCVALSNSSTTVIGSGVIQKKEQYLKDITNIEAVGAFTIIIEESPDSESMSIEADDTILPLIKAKINGNKLTIKTEGSFSSKNPIICRVKVKNIKAVDLKGSIDADLTINNNTKKFSAHISGASTMSGNIVVDKLSIDASGATKIELQGSAIEQKLNVSGSSSYAAHNLLSQKLMCHISGASKAEVHVFHEIDGVISGASTLHYHGNPHTLIKKTGVSTVKRF
jgi:hypothetical protein